MSTESPKPNSMEEFDATFASLVELAKKIELTSAHNDAVRARMESEAQIVGGKLVISLSIGTLAHAARHSGLFKRCAADACPLKITDESVFAKSVCNVLNEEEEDGSTPITRLLDMAFEKVVVWGEDGVEEDTGSAS